jgi:predicted transcriptional regulator
MISVGFKDKVWTTTFSKSKLEKLQKVELKSESIKSKKELDKLLEKVETICSNDYKEKVETEYPDLYVQPVTGAHYLKIGDKVNPIAIPEVLVDRIKTSIDKNVDVTPIIKCWTRFLRGDVLRKKMKTGEAELFIQRFAEYINMTYVMPQKVNQLMEEEGLTKEVASELSKTYEVKITKEGLIECYKTSNEILEKFGQDEDGNVIKVERHPKKTVFNEETGEFDLAEDQDEVLLEDRVFTPYMMGSSGDAFYCDGPKVKLKGHQIRVNHTHYLESWNQVNTNDNTSCVKGLHLGGLSYIASWNADIIHSCFVDPAHIGAICNYSSDNAIRVKQYFVNGSLTEISDSIYHSSTYASQTDKEWEEDKAEILEELGELSEAYETAVSNVVDETKDLISEL